MKKSIKTNNIMKICIGSIVSILIAMCMFTVYAYLIANTQINDNSISKVVFAISVISITIGSVISSLKIRKNGIINGSIVGIIFIITINIISIIINNNYHTSLKTVILIIGSIIIGAIGGVIGINTRKNNREKIKP